MQAHLTLLPLELQQNIFNRCRKDDLLNLRLSCKILQHATFDLFATTFFSECITSIAPPDLGNFVEICRHPLGKYIRDLRLVVKFNESEDALDFMQAGRGFEQLTSALAILKDNGNHLVSLGTWSHGFYGPRTHDHDHDFYRDLSATTLLAAAKESGISAESLSLYLPNSLGLHIFSPPLYRKLDNSGLVLRALEMLCETKQLRLESEDYFLWLMPMGLYDVLRENAMDMNVESLTLKVDSPRQGYISSRMGATSSALLSIPNFPRLRKITLDLSYVSSVDFLRFLEKYNDLLELVIENVLIHTYRHPRSGGRRITWPFILARIRDTMTGLEKLGLGALRYRSRGRKCVYEVGSMVFVGRQEIQQGLTAYQ